MDIGGEVRGSSGSGWVQRDDDGSFATSGCRRVVGSRLGGAGRSYRLGGVRVECYTLIAVRECGGELTTARGGRERSAGERFSSRPRRSDLSACMQARNTQVHDSRLRLTTAMYVQRSFRLCKLDRSLTFSTPSWSTSGDEIPDLPPFALTITFSHSARVHFCMEDYSYLLQESQDGSSNLPLPSLPTLAGGTPAYDPAAFVWGDDTSSQAYEASFAAAPETLQLDSAPELSIKGQGALPPVQGSPGQGSLLTSHLSSCSLNLYRSTSYCSPCYQEAAKTSQGETSPAWGHPHRPLLLSVSPPLGLPRRWS